MVWKKNFWQTKPNASFFCSIFSRSKLSCNKLLQQEELSCKVCRLGDKSPSRVSEWWKQSFKRGKTANGEESLPLREDQESGRATFNCGFNLSYRGELDVSLALIKGDFPISLYLNQLACELRFLLNKQFRKKDRRQTWWSACFWCSRG